MKRKPAFVVAALVVASLLLSSCAGLAAFGDEVSRAFNGVSATMTTYGLDGKKIDEVHGQSFRVSRDTRFDSSGSDGKSNNDSQVLMISLGDSHISHVGSCMTLAQDGVVDVTEAIGPKVAFQNSDPGTPWLNDLIEVHRNLWKGKAKTILIRSQAGYPVRVYAGSTVEIYATDVPKSTWVRIDNKYLLIYRCDYTMYDNNLLGRK